jgi:hypothetical protein
LMDVQHFTRKKMSGTGRTPSSIQSTNRKTLKTFIDENDKLLTAIGVMGALAALFTTLKNGEYLAFLAFLLLYILDYQLVVLIPRIRDSSISLVVFQAFFQAFLGAIGVYIVQQYPKYLIIVIPPVSGSVLVGGFVLLRRKYSRKISALVAGALFAILMLIYYIAIVFFHLSFS